MNASGETWGYAYDEAGNRTAASRGGVAETYASDAANQYTRAGDDAPVYGPGGWLMESGGLEYWFDDADRLAAVFDAATSRETLLRYDHFGRRVAAYSTAWSPGFDSCSTNAGRVLAWDGWTPAREWRAGADGAESVLDYYWGADLSGTVGGAGGVGGLLAVSLDGAWYAPFYDGCGNVVAYVSEAGAVVSEYRYDAFGNTLSQSGPLADAFPFRFSTKRLDAETGLYDYGLRHYKPSWGRWISRDPAGEDGGLNLYAFCGNDPVNGIDPLGLTRVKLDFKTQQMDDGVIVVARDNEAIPCTGGRLSPAAENAAREDTRPPGEFTPINNVQHNKMDEFVTISATVLEKPQRG